MSTRTGSLHARQRGFSLIEVLVSMFIVSLGILALTGLMQASARYGKTSEMRSIATLLANDIADHIRANTGASDPVTNTSSYNMLLAYTPTPANTAPSKDCSSACSPSELAQQDLYAWLKRLNLTLPGGDAYIQYRKPPTANQRGVVDVWVAWTDPMPSAVARTERPDAECTSASTSSDWNNSVKDNYNVRCVYLQVGL
jgi:type IV pilus assembly protein PilV